LDDVFENEDLDSKNRRKLFLDWEVISFTVPDMKGVREIELTGILKREVKHFTFEVDKDKHIKASISTEEDAEQTLRQLKEQGKYIPFAKRH
jgi:hypothetical protein